MELLPKGRQNLFEALVEILYTTFEGVVGKHMIPKVGSLLATLFIFILTANWFGLVPGVGTIGFGEPGGGPLGLKEVSQPLLRPANADLNMTFGMAIFFMIWWVIWTWQEIGPIAFLKENFAPKGGVKGFMRAALLPHGGPGGRVAVSAEFHFARGVSTAVLFSGTVGRSFAGVRFCDAVRCVHKAIGRDGGRTLSVSRECEKD
jgi:hypothetical protein